jgi:hypothetical protein
MVCTILALPAFQLHHRHFSAAKVAVTSPTKRISIHNEFMVVSFPVNVQRYRHCHLFWKRLNQRLVLFQVWLIVTLESYQSKTMVVATYQNKHLFN